ncbi:MAG: bifunctional UDP-sugar hydrolase/5'-nucleotidase [Bryobacterales bacterium]|nr:bifunctional UDP-sugar hydrolase/5'-nucleotidase [Bryobacterales bacterium]
MQQFSRRRFLASAGAMGALHLAGPPLARAEVRSLTILHTNDIHARISPTREGLGGLAHLATAINRERAKAEASLYLEAGDFVQGTPVSSIYEGVPVYELMNGLRPDAVCVGNHEFDYGWQRIYDYLKVSRYPMFCANLVHEQGGLLTPPPYILRDVNGIRVAIIGLMMESLAQLTYAYNLGPWRVLPLVETAQKYIRLAKSDGAQLIVGLAHIFPKEEEMLLAALPEMHLIVSGHDHGGMKTILRDGNRMVVRTRPFGAELGRVDLKFDLAANQVIELNWERFPIVAAEIAPEPAVAKEVAFWEARVSGVVDREIGESKSAYTRFQMKDVVEKAMIESLGVDFAFVNRGAVRAGLVVGKIHAREIWDALPFGNRVVFGKIPGSRIPEAIRKTTTVEADRIYTVATVDYVAANQREIGTEGLEFPDPGPYLREMVIEWVEKRKVVD